MKTKFHCQLLTIPTVPRIKLNALNHACPPHENFVKIAYTMGITIGDVYDSDISKKEYEILLGLNISRIDI